MDIIEKDKTAIRAEVEDMVAIATGRVVTSPDLRAADGYLQAAGVNSIGLINILEALGRRYGIEVGTEEDMFFLETVDSIADRIMEHQIRHEKSA